jgi:signal transduction histidine kinase
MRGPHSPARSGVAFFDPASEEIDTAEKPLLFESASAARANGTFLGLPADDLPHDTRDLRFAFSLLSFTRPEDTRYRTRLDPIDRLPSDWTAEWKKEYPTLPGGRYVLEVWGRDSAGNVSGPVSMAFRIRTAPWLTWWAFTLYALAAAGLVASGVRLRFRALSRRTQTLERAVADRTAAIRDALEKVRSSERLALAKEEEALEASRAKSAFLANMSHELRTPPTRSSATPRC